MANFGKFTPLKVARGVTAFLSSGPRTKKLEQARRQLASKDREIARLRARLATDDETYSAYVQPENIIWVFGMARTGSSWLSAMMGDLAGVAQWREPYVGDVFGHAYYVRAWDWMRARNDYVLGEPYKEVWLHSIRNFVLQGANARFPEVATEGHFLVVKEPNGSLGAPLLMQALPESRLILLIRDPRDVVASLLDASKAGSWVTKQLKYKSEHSLADTDPDKFVYQQADLYMLNLMKAKEAYEAHEGRKVVVRYEDLRYQTLETMKRIYSVLEVPVDEEELAQVVEKHAWENVPEGSKGADKPQRKATPGGWEEDLTPGQARAVEKITAPILDEFYPEWPTADEKRRSLDQ